MVGTDSIGIRGEQGEDSSCSVRFCPPESFSRLFACDATSALTRREGAEILLAKEGRAVLVDIEVEAGADEEGPTGMAEGERVGDEGQETE